VENINIIYDCCKLNVTDSTSEPFVIAPSLYTRIQVMPVLNLCRKARCDVRFSVFVVPGQLRGSTCFRSHPHPSKSFTIHH
jgi:hypothetical protein